MNQNVSALLLCNLARRFLEAALLAQKILLLSSTDGRQNGFNAAASERRNTQGVAKADAADPRAETNPKSDHNSGTNTVGLKITAIHTSMVQSKIQTSQGAELKEQYTIPRGFAKHSIFKASLDSTFHDVDMEAMPSVNFLRRSATMTV